MMPSARSSRSPGRTLRASPSNGVEDASGSADAVAGGDPQRLAGRQLDRPPAFEQAGADFRSAEILQDGDFASRALRRRADARERRGMRLVGAVREIQPEDVGACGNQRVEHGVRIAGGPDRGDDLGVPH